MKRITFYMVAVMLFAMLIVSCKNTPEKEMKKIQEVEDEVFNKNAPIQEPAKLQKLMDLYVAFSEHFPEDSLTPDMMMRAADIAANISQAGYAITLYDKIYNNYPDYSKHQESLFMMAFVNENHLGRLDKAKEFYELFVQKYPDHELTETAKICLKNLGKSPEEMILELLEQQEIQDSI